MADPNGRFGSLAEEIVCNIAARLGSDDMFSLRLTCRALEAKSFHEFAKEYFTSKCVHFSTDSLKPTVEMTESTRLRQHLRQFYVSTKMFTDKYFKAPSNDDDDPEDECSRVWKPSVRVAEAYRGYIKDQTELKRTAQDYAMLVKIFKNVGKLERVGIIDDAHTLSQATDYRGHRKFMRTAHENSGGPTCFNPPVVDCGYSTWMQHIFTTTLRAMHSSGVAVGTLKSGIRSLDNALSPKHFRVSKIRELRNAKFRTITSLALEFSSMEMAPSLSGVMHRAATMFPNVTNVSLRFDTTEIAEGNGKMALGFLGGLKLEKLTRLYLIDLKVNGPKFIDEVLLRLQAIKVLKLEGADLLDHDEDSDEEGLGFDWEEEPASWDAVLEQIKDYSNLQHLHILYPFKNGLSVWLLPERSKGEVSAAAIFQATMSLKDIIQLGEKTYNVDFTNWQFPGGCGEKAMKHCKHGSFLRPTRGFFICLVGQDDIQDKLSKFSEIVDYD